MRTISNFSSTFSSKKFALISCSDKTGLSELSEYFIKTRNNEIASTTSTYKYLIEHLDSQFHEKIHKIENLINYPEILGGRVKTLHPKVLGGILANRLSENDMTDVIGCGLLNIDTVVCNLYPFQEKVSDTTSLNDAIDFIDIGGVTMIRAAAKNFPYITTLTSPKQYKKIIESKEITLAQRFELSKEAFKHTCEYDEHIYKHFDKTIAQNKESIEKVNTYCLEPSSIKVDTNNSQTFERNYDIVQKLKYGCNPHQKLAYILRESNSTSKQDFPIKVLNGNPSYINFLDAIRGWGLVKELSDEFDGRCAAASMKHTSPAGAAIYKEFDRTYKRFLFQSVYHENTDGLDKITETYIRARNSDPLSSFGDFIAVSHPVTVQFANYLKSHVSDGIIAPSFDEDAIAILKKKKKGSYVILEMDPNYEPKDELEFREIFGIGFAQSRNNERVTQDDLKSISDKSAIEDLTLASIVLKYAESNTISIAYQSQLIGLGSGQQSRLHATNLALQKASVWVARHNTDIRKKIEQNLFSNTSTVSRTSKQDIVNKEFEYLNSLDISFQKLNSNSALSLSSDAFFPFRDNIDLISKTPVKYIAQPGGSVRDDDVKKATEEHSIEMVCHSKRMFTH